MDPVGWQTGKTPLECTQYMLHNKVNCDVNFKIGEHEESIKAHKFILSMRSEVFDRMFNGSFCESQEDPVIPDVTSAAFKMLLSYCYYECLDIKDDVALSVLYASTKYMLPLLEKAARKKLIETLGSSNVWDIYKYALNVGETTLLEACHMFFQGNIISVKAALQAEAFLNIPHKVLLDFLHINDEVDNVASLNENSVLESNTDCSKTNSSKASTNLTSVIYKNHIGISISDVELFKSCNAWAEAECLRQEIDPTGTNKRTVLGECLSLIRFPTMLQKDLANVVYPTVILTQSEMVNLGQYIHKDPGSECQADFPSRERQFVATTPDSSTTFPVISSVYMEPEVRVVLSRVWTRGPGSYKVTVTNLTSDSSFCMKIDTKFKGHDTKKFGKSRRMLHFMELKPQLLEANTKYSITAERTNLSDHPDPKLVTKWVHIEDLPPSEEVKITCNSTEDNSIYALTLGLV